MLEFKFIYPHNSKLMVMMHMYCMVNGDRGSWSSYEAICKQ